MAFSTPDIRLNSPTQCSSIEEMQEAKEASGWTARYRQLQSGMLTMNSCSREVGDVSLLETFASRSIEVAGRTPAHRVTVLIAGEDSRFWANGHTLGQEEILVLGPEAQLHFVGSENCTVLSMHLTVGISQSSPEAHDTGGIRRCKEPVVLKPGTRETSALRGLIFRVIHEQAGSSRHKELAGALTNNVERIIETCAGPGLRTERSGAAESQRVINRACEYIEENFHRPFSMTDLASHAVGSVSKLERVFRRQIGLSPSRYVLATRLTAARERLLVADTDTTRVSEVAMDSGFRHLGRFAAAYRSHFGELPSTTLRR